MGKTYKVIPPPPTREEQEKIRKQQLEEIKQ